MSFKKFIKDLDELEEIAYANMSIIDISKFIITDKEILKKILIEKNPNLPIEDIEMIAESAYPNEDEDSQGTDPEEIKGKLEEDPDNPEDPDEPQLSEDPDEPEDIETKAERKEKRRKEKEERRDKLEKKRKERKDKLKKERKERKDFLKEMYKDKMNELKQEVKDLKNKVKSAIFEFLNKFKEVGKAFILALMKTITSVPGAISMSVLPPWNVPGAVTSLLTVIVQYLDVLSKIQSIVPFMQPLRKIPNFIKSSEINVIGKILDIATITMIALYFPILKLKEFIEKLIKFIKSLFTKSVRSEKIFKKATKKLVKLGHIESTKIKIVSIIEGEGDDSEEQRRIHRSGIPSKSIGNRILTQPRLIERFDDNGQQFTIESDDPLATEETPIRVFAWDPEDIDEVLSLLGQFEITEGEKWGGKKHVSGYRGKKKIDELLVNLEIFEKDLQDEDEKTKEIISELGELDSDEFSQFVYDIVLDDGTVIQNISSDGLEYYRKKFELVFSEISNQLENSNQ
jgi:hypothetical protein